MPARAKLPPGEGKRVPLNMRTTRETREKLEKSAAESGRSLAQEVEYRLERSFADEPQSVSASAITRLLNTAMFMVEQQTGKDATDYETYVAVKAAITGILDSLQPPMSDELRNRIDEHSEKYPIPGLLDPGAPIAPTLKATVMGVEAGNFIMERIRERIASARNTKTAAATPRKTD